MTRSADEEEIRTAVVARLRELLPNARIVHELNTAGTGSNRIDVAAIGAQLIVGVEIKSKKDTLKRLSDQWRTFSACCHEVVVAAHEKHFREYRDDFQRADVPGRLRLNHPEFFESWSRESCVWRFPRPDAADDWRPLWGLGVSRRRSTVARIAQPRAAVMLEMLWASELRAECARHGLADGARRTRPVMIADMVWHMTGREICEAVCRQLRAREFAEADAPVLSEAA